jgi:hypothetical protein
VRTYTVYLSSDQNLGLPGLYDGVDFSTADIVYDFITDGGQFNYTPDRYTVTANDGSFFPWKYVINSYVYPTIVLPPLKGPYTINISTSALDTSLFGIIKILYDFGDGSGQMVEYPLGSFLKGVALIDTPNNTNVSHTYYPLSLSGTTYTPSLTVLNGNLITFVYNISAAVYPGSIYDFDNVHLLESTSLGVSSSQMLNVFETRKTNYATHVINLSSKNTYNPYINVVTVHGDRIVTIKDPTTDLILI